MNNSIKLPLHSSFPFLGLQKDKILRPNQVKVEKKYWVVLILHVSYKSFYSLIVTCQSYSTFHISFFTNLHVPVSEWNGLWLTGKTGATSYFLQNGFYKIQ